MMMEKNRKQQDKMNAFLSNKHYSLGIPENNQGKSDLILLRSAFEIKGLVSLALNIEQAKQIK